MLFAPWNSEQRSRRWWIPPLIVFAICAAYAGLLSTRGMPPTEGWYSHYAYLINEEGAVPYRDFELLFPPLYTYLIALFCRVFGYGILALRILGVWIYALTGLLAYLIFERLTRRPIFAVLAGLLTASILQSEVVQIFYDYIRWMDLAIYLSIYFFIVAIEGVRESGRVSFLEPSVLLGAFFAVLASLFKQSSGLIYLLFCLLFLVFAALVFPSAKQYLKMIGSSLCVIVLCYGTTVLFLMRQGALRAYLYYNFGAALSAKGGSISTLLFGWLIRANLTLAELLLGVLGLLAACAALLWLYLLGKRRPLRVGDPILPLRTQILIGLGAFLVLFLFASVVYEPLRPLWFGAWKQALPFLAAMISFATVSVAAIAWRIQGKSPANGTEVFCFFSGCVFTVAYSVCTSGGLVESQIALGYPLLALLLLPLIKFRKSEWLAIGLSALMLFNTGLGFERKIRAMYGWWGLETGSLSAQTETADVPYLSGIRMAPAYAAMYEGVYQTVNEYTSSEDGIFVFPHMPVFYLLCGRPQATNMANVWFDVTTDRGVIADIDVIRRVKPKVMVICLIDDYVIHAHEASFRGGEKSGLHEMQDFLIDFITKEQYVKHGSYTVSPAYTVEVWVLP